MAHKVAPNEKITIFGEKFVKLSLFLELLEEEESASLRTPSKCQKKMDTTYYFQYIISWSS